MHKKPGKNNIALIGSSHAGHLFYGLSKLSTKEKPVFNRIVSLKSSFKL